MEYITGHYSATLGLLQYACELFDIIAVLHATVWPQYKTQITPHLLS